MVGGMWPAMTNGVILLAVISLEMNSAPWRAVNDGVMGGLSSGGVEQQGRNIVFRGDLSLENNGGFASVRRLVRGDLAGADRVRLKVRGDGRSYQFRIRQDEHFDGIAWRSMLPTNGEWQTVELAFDDFEPVFRGRTVREAGPVIPGRIRQVGFMLADKAAGPFELEIAAIDFLSGETGSGQ
jgi:monofunctional biosynthetic peptidoglycan transglycosylase